MVAPMPIPMPIIPIPPMFIAFMLAIFWFCIMFMLTFTAPICMFWLLYICEFWLLNAIVESLFIWLKDYSVFEYIWGSDKIYIINLYNHIKNAHITIDIYDSVKYVDNINHILDPWTLLILASRAGITLLSAVMPPLCAIGILDVLTNRYFCYFIFISCVLSISSSGLIADLYIYYRFLFSPIFTFNCVFNCYI